MRKTGAPKARKPIREPKLSHTRRPGDMDVAQWQTRLRRQFGRAQAFRLENIGESAFFSEYRVTNPQSRTSYRVAIRSTQPGENFCACPDFATNDLGTCKHIEFVLGKLEKKPGGRKALAQGFHPPYSEIYLQYDGERRVRWRAGTGCPPTLRRRAERLFNGSPAGVLPIAYFSKLGTFLEEARKAGHELRCYEDALGFIAQVRDATERRRIIDTAYPEGARSPALKGLVKAELYPYQAEGALFAARAGRCLIGDEMGLGKTIQAIAAAELFARHFGAERVLVVCPTSLKHQWQKEIGRFTSREAQVISGLRAARARQYKENGYCKIVNYDVLDNDLALIRAWSPDVVIADEAQRIKNWNTIAARALKRIESPYAIVLTGTPLENRLEELVSIIQFVDRHRLGATWKLRHAHQSTDDAGRVIGYKDLDKLGKTLAPVLLRRRKSEVLSQLPPRVDNTIFVPMTDEQRIHHDENGEIVARIVQRWRRTGYLSDADQRRLTCALQNMRMACNSTYLLDQKTDDGAKPDELVTLLEEWFEQPDAKAVVFSQWMGTHELIARRLETKRWDYALFHGGIPGGRRGAVVERFHKDPSCRVFLSTDAGGVGLNLQHAASIVVNMDLPWNPAVLEQRIGRVHRLGQLRSVQVVNFVAEDTIEERMQSLLAFKRSLFAGVLDGGQSEVFLGGSRLAKFMESVNAVTAGSAEVAPEQAAQRAPKPTAVSTRPPAPAEAPSAAPQPIEAASNPWTPLLTAGLKLVEALAAAPLAVGGGNGKEKAPTTSPSPWIETDARTGRPYLRLPLPEPQVVQQLSDVLSRLISGFGR
ncbi:MAG: DEAD/DEAH box helicase [Steroidobacteraceae bacterium]